jgi:hypothetical protein
MKAAVSSGFDLLGAEALEPAPKKFVWTRSALAIAAGAVAASVFKRHPVLAFLDTAAAVSNAHAVYVGERTWRDAAKRMGRHVVATVGSLTVPKYPAAGYVAGAVAGDLLFDGEGGGIIDEIANYEGIKSSKPRGDVIDAEFTETKSPPNALVKT